MSTDVSRPQDEASNLLNSERLATALVWMTPALWAVNFIVARTAPGVIGPYTLAFGRWGLAGAILLALTYRELWRYRTHLIAAWYQYVALGFLGMLVCGAWVYLGAQTTGAMNMSLIYAASPVLISIGAVVWFGERFTSRQGLGVLLALAGVVHVVVKGHWLAFGEMNWIVGDVWIVLAMLSWSLYALLQKMWSSQLSATARLSAICSGGVVTLLPCVAWELSLPGAPGFSLLAVELIVASAVFPGLAAYWIHGWSQRILGASRVAVALYLNPLYAAVVAWAVLGEPLGWHHLVGACLILSGVFFVTVSRRSGN